MHGKTTLFLLVSVFLLTTCKSYKAWSTSYSNGLSCQNYVDYRLFVEDGEAHRVEGADCSYTCPNGTISEVNIEGSISPLYAASSEELDTRFCGIAAPSTPTPVVTRSPTPRTLTPTTSPTRTPTLTALVTAEPLLSDTVSMCDLGGKLINFRILDSALELPDDTLTVQIAGDDSTCYRNPTNPSLLTCTLPNNISFPVHIVVTLRGALVYDFMYSGLGCSIVTTPTSGPRSYP